MDHMMLEQTEQTEVETSSQSGQESNPTTITIHAHQEDVEEDHEVSLESNMDDNRETIEAAEVYDGSSLQYQLKSENGQVTYRVLHSGEIGSEQQTGTIGGQNVVQAIIASNPFGASNTSVTSTNNDGPFYVMMAPTQEILSPSPTPTNNTVSTIRKTVSSGEPPRAVRDEKRRATHNEVERRRRDKINNWIMKLAKIVPDCSLDHTKQGQQSKGGILAKACEYIADLVNENAKLHDIVKENDLLSTELDTVRQQSLLLKNENRRLRAILQRNGIQFEES